jgi:hypothetical protein
MRQISIRRWTSTRPSEKPILEICPAAALEGDDMAEVLRQVAPHLKDCSMLILTVSSLDAKAWSSALETAERLDLAAHVCIAVGSAESILFRHDEVVRSDRVGLLLDKVDDHTPLSHIVREGVEAIRFDRAFARHAADHSRSECVLEAILGLARNTGLCTLGPNLRRSGEEVSTIAFDYVPERAILADALAA